MTANHKNKFEHSCISGKRLCCKVESIVSVDERGQMVLPKEIRDKAKIKPGDKLAIISWEKERGICGFSLIKANDLAEIVKAMFGPIVKWLPTKKGK